MPNCLACIIIFVEIVYNDLIMMIKSFKKKKEFGEEIEPCLMGGTWLLIDQFVKWHTGI